MYCLVDTKMWMYFWFGMTALAMLVALCSSAWLLKSKRTDLAPVHVLTGVMAVFFFFLGFTFLTKVMQYEADPGAAYCGQVSGALLFKEAK